MGSDASARVVAPSPQLPGIKRGHRIGSAEIPGIFDEARCEQRTPCHPIPASVQPGATSERLIASVVDVSVRGVRLRLGSSLEVDSEVTVWFERVVATGQVRYCRRVQDGPFEAGLSISEVLNTA
jgi:hypothetical protein